MVVMIAEQLAAVCLETTAPDVVAWLKAKKIEIIPVPFQDTVTLGCNVMSLGKDRVIAPKHSRALIEALTRNIYGDAPSAGIVAPRLADYMLEAVVDLKAQDADSLAAGVLRFPDPAAARAAPQR